MLLGIIQKAEKFGREKHKGQLDDEGSDYFNVHCRGVFGILLCVTDNPHVLVAGLLHDTLEDTKTTYEELEKEFGKKVADLVNEVTHEGKKDEVGFYFPRLKSKEAILIKFADRLSNLSRMNAWPKERQEHYLKKSKFWKQKREGFENLIDKHIKNISNHKGNEIENKIYVGKIQTLKRLKNDLKDLKC